MSVQSISRGEERLVDSEIIVSRRARRGSPRYTATARNSHNRGEHKIRKRVKVPRKRIFRCALRYTCGMPRNSCLRGLGDESLSISYHFPYGKICENKFVSLLKAFYREIFNRISKYLMHNYIGIIGRW